MAEITSENIKESRYYLFWVSSWYGSLPPEYPLWDGKTGCPNALYVGGETEYLCGCEQPLECPGVLKVADEFERDIN